MCFSWEEKEEKYSPTFPCINTPESKALQYLLSWLLLMCNGLVNL